MAFCLKHLLPLLSPLCYCFSKATSFHEIQWYVYYEISHKMRVNASNSILLPVMHTNQYILLKYTLFDYEITFIPNHCYLYSSFLFLFSELYTLWHTIQNFSPFTLLEFLTTLRDLLFSALRIGIYESVELGGCTFIFAWLSLYVFIRETN